MYAFLALGVFVFFMAKRLSHEKMIAEASKASRNHSAPEKPSGKKDDPTGVVFRRVSLREPWCVQDSAAPEYVRTVRPVKGVPEILSVYVPEIPPLL